MKVSVEKPGTPEDVLAHYGKLGMKWGVRTRNTSSGPTSSKLVNKSINSSYDRMSARRGRKNWKRSHPTSMTRTLSINEARGSVNSQKKALKGEKNIAKRARLEKTYLRNPDRATALRMTRGEKAVMIGIAAVLPGGLVPVVGITSGQVLWRHHVEKQQVRLAKSDRREKKAKGK